MFRSVMEVCGVSGGTARAILAWLKSAASVAVRSSLFCLRSVSGTRVAMNVSKSVARKKRFLSTCLGSGTPEGVSWGRALGRNR